MKEKWLPVPGFDGYEVSDQGRVRSWRGSKGTVRRTPLIRKLQSNTRTGYLYVMLSGQRKLYLRQVHVMVLEAFVGLRPHGFETRHLDRDITNNRLGNLRWGTPREQFEDQVRHGTDTRGERNGGAKLKNSDAKKIRRLLTKGHAGTVLAERFCVSQATITRIKKRQRYATV